MADTPAFPTSGREPPRSRGGRSASGLGFLDHLLILRALMLRDVKLRSQKMGALGPAMELLMPIVVMALHYFIFVALKRGMPAHIPVEYYVLAGFTTWFAFRNPSARPIRGEDDVGPTMLPGVTRLHFLAAGVVWECALSLFLLYAGLVLSTCLLGSSTYPNVLQNLFVFIVAAVLGIGYRLTFDAIGYLWMPAKAVKKPLTWFMFLTSGIYFTAQSQEQNILTECAAYNPLMYLIEPQRQALWPEYPVFQVNLVYPCCCAVGLIALGWILKRQLRGLERR